MNRINQITAFISVVEEQGFAAAARKQGISTAAISRKISKLESELKTQLLWRSTRRIGLTEIGAQYYQQVKKTMLQLHEAELSIAYSQSEAVGLLHISTGRHFAKEYLLPRLPEFMRLNPKLQIKIELEERFSDLLEDSIDIIFGSTLEQLPDIVQRRIGSSHSVICASPDYLAQYGTPKVPLDLNHHRYITHSGRMPDNQITFSHHAPVWVNPILWLNESHTMCDFAINGMGIVKLHYYIVAEALAAGDLIEVLTEFNEAEKPVYLYYKSSRYLQPKIRRFIDFYTIEF